jgi:hypothetical protein
MAGSLDFNDHHVGERVHALIRARGRDSLQQWRMTQSLGFDLLHSWRVPQSRADALTVIMRPFLPARAEQIRCDRGDGGKLTRGAIAFMVPPGLDRFPLSDRQPRNWRGVTPVMRLKCRVR